MLCASIDTYLMEQSGNLEVAYGICSFTLHYKNDLIHSIAQPCNNL